MHFTTGQIIAFVGFISTIGALWRFTIKPIFDKQHALEEWRRQVNIRLVLIEHSLPDCAAKQQLRDLRQGLTDGAP